MRTFQVLKNTPSSKKYPWANPKKNNTFSLKLYPNCPEVTFTAHHEQSVDLKSLQTGFRLDTIWEPFLCPGGMHFSMLFSNASFEPPERHRMAQGREKGAKGQIGRAHV